MCCSVAVREISGAVRHTSQEGWRCGRQSQRKSILGKAFLQPIVVDGFGKASTVL